MSHIFIPYMRAALCLGIVLMIPACCTGNKQSQDQSATALQSLLESIMAKHPSTPQPSIKYEDLTTLQIAGPEDLAADGFRYQLHINYKTQETWLVQTGGFAGVKNWFGPAPLDDARIKWIITNAIRPIDKTRHKEPLKIPAAQKRRQKPEVRI